jgi:hypothetical protein
MVLTYPLLYQARRVNGPEQRAARIELLQRAMQDLQYQIDQKDDKIKDFKREAEDLRTR